MTAISRWSPTDYFYFLLAWLIFSAPFYIFLGWGLWSILGFPLILLFIALVAGWFEPPSETSDISLIADGFRCISSDGQTVNVLWQQITSIEYSWDSWMPLEITEYPKAIWKICQKGGETAHVQDKDVNSEILIGGLKKNLPHFSGDLLAIRLQASDSLGDEGKIRCWSNSDA